MPRPEGVLYSEVAGRRVHAVCALRCAACRDGQLVNVKYRTLDKKFWQVKGAEKVLYGLDDIAPGATDVVIVEGEVDKLSLMEAGIKAVVSVSSC